MARSRPPTAADLIGLALAPAFVILMVYALVGFLAEVVNAGEYGSRLRSTLFFFVVGVVLTTRISLSIDAGRAAIYGLLLSGASFVALQVFVEYPPGTWLRRFSVVVNLGFMSIIWWAGYALTKSCTHYDGARDGSDRGILSVLGLERVAAVPGRRRGADDAKPHTPGLAVVYFALAAVPLFGLGQSLIPSGDGARRALAFRMAAMYLVSALALLLITSFLNLRRYLRRRDVTMPKAMTAAWLGGGAVVIVAVVALAALLPRPYSETPLVRLSKGTDERRDASERAVKGDGAGKGQGKPGDKKTLDPEGKKAIEGEKGGGGSKKKRERRQLQGRRR